MSRLRKSSLSPCYANSNKENLPIDNLTSPIGISFKNLEQARKKKTIEPTPMPKASQLNNPFFKHSQKSNLSPSPSPSPSPLQSSRPHESTHNKSIDDYRSSLKSKEKQMSSLANQVNTLNCTVGLLKEQANGLKQENLALVAENGELRRVVKQKNQLIERMKKQKHYPSPTPITKPSIPQPCQKCLLSPPNHDQQYQQVLQKLSQLQQIQNKLLLQNEKLTKKQSMHQAMLRNFKTLIEGGRIRELEDLINVLNQ